MGNGDDYTFFVFFATGHYIVFFLPFLGWVLGGGLFLGHNVGTFSYPAPLLNWT